MKIPITDILLHLRHRVAEGDAQESPVAPSMTRIGAKIGALALGTPWLYRLGSPLVKVGQAPFRRDGWLPKLPPSLNRWTMARPFPTAQGDFRRWWRSRTSDGGGTGGGRRWRTAGVALAAIGVLAGIGAWGARNLRK